MIPVRTWPALSPTDQRRLTTWKALYRLQQCDGFTKAQALRLCFTKWRIERRPHAPPA